MQDVLFGFDRSNSKLEKENMIIGVKTNWPEFFCGNLKIVNKDIFSQKSSYSYLIIFEKCWFLFPTYENGKKNLCTKFFCKPANLFNTTNKIFLRTVMDISRIGNKNNSLEDSNTEMKVDRPGKTIEVAFITEISH